MNSKALITSLLAVFLFLLVQNDEETLEVEPIATTPIATESQNEKKVDADERSLQNDNEERVETTYTKSPEDRFTKWDKLATWTDNNIHLIHYLQQVISKDSNQLVTEWQSAQNFCFKSGDVMRERELAYACLELFQYPLYQILSQACEQYRTQLGQRGLSACEQLSWVHISLEFHVNRNFPATSPVKSDGEDFVLESVLYYETDKINSALADYYRKYCEKDNKVACSQLSMYTADKKEKELSSQRACDLGLGWQCEVHTQYTTDTRTKFKLNSQACTHGRASGCIEALKAKLQPGLESNQLDVLQSFKRLCTDARSKGAITGENCVAFLKFVSNDRYREKLNAEDLLQAHSIACRNPDNVLAMPRYCKSYIEHATEFGASPIEIAEVLAEPCRRHEEETEHTKRRYPAWSRQNKKSLDEFNEICVYYLDL